MKEASRPGATVAHPENAKTAVRNPTVKRVMHYDSARKCSAARENQVVDEKRRAGNPAHLQVGHILPGEPAVGSPAGGPDNHMT